MDEIIRIVQRSSHYNEAEIRRLWRRAKVARMAYSLVGNGVGDPSVPSPHRTSS